MIGEPRAAPVPPAGKIFAARGGKLYNVTAGGAGPWTAEAGHHRREQTSGPGAISPTSPGRSSSSAMTRAAIATTTARPGRRQRGRRRGDDRGRRSRETLLRDRVQKAVVVY